MMRLLPLLHNQRQRGCCCTRLQGEYELSLVETQRVYSTKMNLAARSANDSAVLAVDIMHLAGFCWDIQVFGGIAHGFGGSGSPRRHTCGSLMGGACGQHDPAAHLRLCL